jgi:hypothetical protein
MPIERRLLSYIAMLIATIYYFFGKAEAATPELPTVSGQQCEQARLNMFECKAAPTRPRVGAPRQ